MIEADSVRSTPPLNSSASNIIDLSAARTAARDAAATRRQPGGKTLASGLPESAEAAILNLPNAPDPIDELDRASEILRAAVTYTSLNGAYNGAWRAEHTGNSTVAEMVTDGMWRRRAQALRKLTRLMNKADTVRTVELWSVASVADVVMDQYGDGESGKNLEPFEVHFLRSFFRLIERDCEQRRNTEQDAH